MLKSLRRMVFGDLRANRGQFFAVWLVVTLGTAFYGAMYPAGVNMLNSFYRTYDDLNYMDFQVQRESFSADEIAAAGQIPGVEHVEGRLVVESGWQADPAHTYLIALRLISVPDDRLPDVNRSEIEKGRAIQEADEVLVLTSFAEHHGIMPGDILTLTINGTQHDLRVAGLVFNPEYLVAGRGPTSPFPSPSTFGVAWMRYSQLAALAGQGSVINDLVIRLEGSAADDHTTQENAVRAALATLFTPDSGASIFSRIQTASGGVVDANINGNFPIMIFFSGVFLAGSTVITGILLARLVESERQRIGTMRALGVTRRELVVHYLTFGFIIGLTGGLVGSVLGYLNSFWVMDTYLNYIAGGSLPGFVNRPQLPFIALGFGIVLAGSTFAGAYPAWTLSGTPPGIALRPAAPKTPNAVSRAGLRFLPVPVRQAIRNLLRTPGRSLSTALGVMAGALMIFACFALWDTMAITFRDYFAINEYDLRADLDTLMPWDTLRTQGATLDGVESAQVALAGPVTILRDGSESFVTVMIALDGDDPFFDLRTIEGDAALSVNDAVWIGHNLQRVLDLHPGDVLTLSILEQFRTARIAGVVSNALGSPVFVPRTLAAQWVPGGTLPANMLLLRSAPGQAGAVRDAAAQLPGVVGVEITSEFKRDTDFYLEYFRMGTVIFGAFGYILTLALLFNTVNANLRERHDELAILRALGSTRYEIALTVTIELVIMVLIGVAVGMPLGRSMGFWLNHTYDTDFFGQVNTLLPRSYVIGILSLLAVVLLAELPGLRAVQRTDLGQISKSQSF